ncbi:LysE family translocator [Caenimonas aquaedulcis]|uniref:LysE family translocator n=1 Tax=Caenimonas aquaedulcis TaxID=2793270 RepID=A0A931H633_9BURK|nr:LysE family translocator [Caenimonas aquaedulcis]MBG9389349.1 LysE family translocator [Caenimonas aquaedulcis]
MDSSPQLWLFFLMVLGIVILPGVDMAFVAASALGGGRRGGAFAVAGIVAGGFCHVAASALGIGLLIHMVPAIFNTVLLVGAAYIAWIGISLMRAASSAQPMPLARSAGRPWATFRQAILTSLLNPKAYLFMFAVFPQFLQPERGAVWSQSAVLSLIIATTQIWVYGLVAVAAGSAQAGLGSRPQLQAWLMRGAGAMLVGGAAWTALEGWRRMM